MDRSTILESDEDVFVLIHDLPKELQAEIVPLLLSDLIVLQLPEIVVVAGDRLFVHYKEEYQRTWRTGQYFIRYSRIEDGGDSRRETQRFLALGSRINRFVNQLGKDSETAKGARRPLCL